MKIIKEKLIMNCLEVRALQEHHLPELYRLMVVQNFPDVPESFGEAEAFFATAYAFGAFSENELRAGFLFGDVTLDSAFLDVVCAPNFHGKWATKGTLKQLHRIAFLEMDLDYIWVQPQNKRALKTCLQAGFVPTTHLEADEPVLILTRHAVAKSLPMLGN